jgi:hypothetical protein
VPVLRGFQFKVGEGEELFVMNPPLVKFKDQFLEEDTDYPVCDGTE